MLDGFLYIWPKACLCLCTTFLELERTDVLQHQASVAKLRRLEFVFHLTILEALCHLYQKQLYSGRAWVVGGNVQRPYELEVAD